MFSRKQIFMIVIAMLLFGIVLFSMGCGGGSSSNSEGPTSASPISSDNSDMGSLLVNITDSPFSDASNLSVTISDIEAHKTGNGEYMMAPPVIAMVSSTTT